MGGAPPFPRFLFADARRTPWSSKCRMPAGSSTMPWAAVPGLPRSSSGLCIAAALSHRGMLSHRGQHPPIGQHARPPSTLPPVAPCGRETALSQLSSFHAQTSGTDHLHPLGSARDIVHIFLERSSSQACSRPGDVEYLDRKCPPRNNGTFAAGNAGHPASQWLLTFRR